MNPSSTSADISLSHSNAMDHIMSRQIQTELQELFSRDRCAYTCCWIGSTVLCRSKSSLTRFFQLAPCCGSCCCSGCCSGSCLLLLLGYVPFIIFISVATARTNAGFDSAKFKSFVFRVALCSSALCKSTLQAASRSPRCSGSFK